MPGHPTNLDKIGQGSTVLARDAVGGYLDIFFSRLSYFFSSSLSARRPNMGRKLSQSAFSFKQTIQPNSVSHVHTIISQTACDLLVGCFGLNSPLRQYFSLYRTVSQREGERREKS